MTVMHMNCVEGMRMFPDNTFDSIVTDPPYELGFMGKSWDSTGIAYNVDMWCEALRVLKPGGHLLSFSGSRTYHRMACAIEDAGFDIRDQIMWVYGSGFPKSLDVSKAIDKRGGNAGLTAEIGAAIKAARTARKMSATECDRLFCGGTTNWSWFEGRPTGQRAPTPGTFAVLAAAWPELVPYAGAVAEVERQILGQAYRVRRESTVQLAGNSEGYFDLTAPATDAARQWDGWGTALKPAHEPICVARKPLIGTVAANVLAHGTGALNIDGCRVHGEDSAARAYTVARTAPGATQNATGKTKQEGAVYEGMTKDGRWPANLIHDGSHEVVAAFPDAKGQQGDVSTTAPSAKTSIVYGAMRRVGEPSADSENNGEVGFKMKPGARRLDEGSAARFFYCAKASKKDRGEGNTHPTVKPTDLMRYLVRLVTPPGGVVLDPFAGSGSTFKAATAEGFDFIGFELQAEYVALANARGRLTA